MGAGASATKTPNAKVDADVGFSKLQEILKEGEIDWNEDRARNLWLAISPEGESITLRELVKLLEKLDAAVTEARESVDFGENSEDEDEDDEDDSKDVEALKKQLKELKEKKAKEVAKEEIERLQAENETLKQASLKTASRNKGLAKDNSKLKEVIEQDDDDDDDDDEDDEEGGASSAEVKKLRLEIAALKLNRPLGGAAAAKVSSLLKQVNHKTILNDELEARAALAEEAAAPLQKEVRLLTEQLETAKKELSLFKATPTPPAPKEVEAAVSSAVSVADEKPGDQAAAAAAKALGLEGATEETPPEPGSKEEAVQGWSLQGLIASAAAASANGEALGSGLGATLSHALTRKLREALGEKGIDRLSPERELHYAKELGAPGGRNAIATLLQHDAWREVLADQLHAVLAQLRSGGGADAAAATSAKTPEAAAPPKPSKLSDKFIESAPPPSPVVTSTFLVAATLDTFDADEFKAELASHLNVAPSAIGVKMKESAEKGKLEVKASTAVKDTAAAKRVEETLTKTTSAKTKGWSTLIKSVRVESVSEPEIDQSKTVELAFGEVKQMMAGLEAMVGKMSADPRKKMEDEHCDGKAHPDVKRYFTTGNYGVKTTSEIEWWFVVEPDRKRLSKLKLDAWPTEDKERCNHGRSALPLSAFSAARKEIDAELRTMGLDPLTDAELIGARLYTGPMFVKYNGVLRGKNLSFAAWCLGKDLCDGNHYIDTIHSINLALLKLAKIVKAEKLYRGMGGMRLSKQFLELDKYLIAGGVEFGFMSTTVDHEVAARYAAGNPQEGEPPKAGVLFEIQQGMGARGADLSKLSQYPGEKEICFPPLTGLEVRKLADGKTPATRVEKRAPTVTIVELLPTLPPGAAAPTPAIELVSTDEKLKLAEEEARALLEAAKKEAEEIKQKAKEKALEANKDKKEVEERARKEAEERARKEAEERARKEAEERARKETEERSRREAEERARREAAERARKAAEERERKEAADQREREQREQREREQRQRARPKTVHFEGRHDNGTKIDGHITLSCTSGDPSGKWAVTGNYSRKKKDKGGKWKGDGSDEIFSSSEYDPSTELLTLKIPVGERAGRIGPLRNLEKGAKWNLGKWSVTVQSLEGV